MKQYSDIVMTRANKLEIKNYPSKEGKVFWQSPSNIAIVKYWGKYPGQIPANASLSLSLNKSLSRTKIEYNFNPKENQSKLDFKFDGKHHQAFSERLKIFLNKITPYLPWLAHTDLTISSENTFPHSAGIASSASAMSALVLGLCDIERQIFDIESEPKMNKIASFLARLGSGSASRSIYGNMAIWGNTKSWIEASNEYAVPLNPIHENFKNIHDSILIIEYGEKEVSSSTGHELMKSNPYANKRFESAEQNLQKLIPAIEKGDWITFIEIMEHEALSLHAMMMTSNPGYILMKPNTLLAIDRIRSFRKNTACELGFTLDAGANVHIIYSEKDYNKVQTFIENDLVDLCEKRTIIHDQMGNGPKRILN